MDRANVDFVFRCWHDRDGWQVESALPEGEITFNRLVVAACEPEDSVRALVCCSIDEDFLLLLRAPVAGAAYEVGDEAMRQAQTEVLLGDMSAADEWPIARNALTHLQIPWPQELPEGDDVVIPAGSTSLLADLGMEAPDLVEILSDADLYPDEMLMTIAEHLGFADALDAAFEALEDED